MRSSLELVYDENKNKPRQQGIFIQAWSATVHHKLWKFLLGSAGALYAAIKFAIELSQGNVAKGILLAIAFLFVIFLLIYLLHVAWFGVLHLKRIWIEAHKDANMRHLRQIINMAHTLRECKDAKEIILNLDGLCDFLAEIFNDKTSSKCSVSIKIPLNPCSESAAWHLQNLCRDNIHKDSRDTLKYKNADHNILNNTAYNDVVCQIYSGEPIKGYINNDIEASMPPNGSYRNSSLVRSENGKLPYKSEFVYPILVECYPTDWRGFLCIDSDKKNSFNAQGSEIEFIVNVSANLYYVVKTLRDLQPA